MPTSVPVSTFSGFAPRTLLRHNENSTLAVAEFTPVEASAFDFAPVLSGADAALFEAEMVDGAVVLRFIDAPDFETPLDANGDNRYVVTVSRNYGTESVIEGVATATIIVRVTDLFEPKPIFLSNGAGDALTVTYDNLTGLGTYVYRPLPRENGTGTVLSISAVSPDPSLGAPRLTFAGADAALFTMDEDGNVSFIAAPDFEAPADANGDNVYELTFTATAGASNTATARIVVQNINETPPEITSPLGTTAPEIITGAPYGGGLLAYVPAANPGDANGLGWSISGDDAARFSFDRFNNIFFNAAPDFEAPSDADGNGIYRFTLTVTSDGGFTDSQDVTVTLTNVNEAPVTSSAAALTVSENAAGTVYAGIASDEDGDTLSWSIEGTDAALFAIDSDTGAVTFVTPADFERPTDSDGDNYYEFTVVASDGALSDSQAVRMRIVNANDAPVITSDTTATVVENSTALIYVATATDDDRDAITFTLGGADAALFTLSGGMLRFTAGADFEAPGDADDDGVYALIINASDGTLTSSLAMSVTVTNVAEAPVVTSATSVSFAENGLGVAYRATAFAETGEPVTWLLGGVDAGLFGIDSLTGAVSFLAPRDFETPIDAGGDKIYDIKVFAGTPSGFVGEGQVSIAVTNINDVVILGTIGGDSLVGTNGIDTIIGLEGDDLISGRGAQDTLSGGGGDDILNGGRGADSMAGGADNDIYLVDDVGDVVFEEADGGLDTVRTSISLVLADDGGVERLTLLGSAAINGTGNSLDNALEGNIAANLLSGLDGADTIRGGVGDDTVIGGAGDDNLAGGAGFDLIEGGEGNDDLRGGNNADTMLGGLGDDTYLHEDASDLIIEAAGEGDDVVIALASIVMADGSEIELVQMRGSADLDATGNGGDNQIEGNSGHNTLSGLGGADRLVGNAGDDEIDGGDGNDTLFGSAGDDTLQGGEGGDRLLGGTGADTFVYDGIAEGGDLVISFETGIDVVQVSASGFFGVDVAAGDDLVALGRFTVNDTGLPTGALAQFIYESDTGRLLFDANGDAAGGRELLVNLVGAPGFTAADFMLVA